MPGDAVLADPSGGITGALSHRCGKRVGMRYGDQKLIWEYAKLQLAIAAAKNPDAKHDVSEQATLQRGYKLLRARLFQLSPKKRAELRRMWQMQIDGVRIVMEQAKATGEAVTLADLEMDVFDVETRERVPDAPNVKLEEAKPENENSGPA